MAVWVLSAAAGAADLKTVTKELFTVPSTTGNEDRLAAKIRGLLPKDLAVEADGLGTIAVRAGGAAGPTLILAALDGYGHMVSGITPDGYLTLDRPVAPPHARFDAFLLGQPVIISTAKGPVHGVVSQPAMHLLTPERRKTLVEGFTLETAYVDIGVRSEKEARAKGVGLLDAVTYPAVWTELAGDRWAGPGLGLKAAAAGLVAADLGPVRPFRRRWRRCLLGRPDEVRGPGPGRPSRRRRGPGEDEMAAGPDDRCRRRRRR